MECLKDLWQIKYYKDNIIIWPATCLYPHDKNCDHKRCGITAEEARLEFVKYYQDEVNYYSNMTTEDFLKEQGYID